MRRILFLLTFLPFILINGNDIHAGIEISELLQNSFNNLGPQNFTFFAGQRLEKYLDEKLGWEIMAMNVQLSRGHLADSVNVPFIEGDRDEMNGYLTVLRANAEYYIFGWEWGIFRFCPIASAGVGYNRFVYLNNDEQVEYREPSIGIGLRLRFIFFEHIFIEYPVVDAFIKPYREKEWVGGAYLNYPEYFGMFMWLKAGVVFNFPG